MDSIFDAVDTKHGVTGLLASICILLTIYIIFKVFTFVYQVKAEKDRERESLSEKSIQDLTESMRRNTEAIAHLDNQLRDIEKLFVEFPKFKLDLRRVYTAIKFLAKEDWAEIRKEMMNEQDF